MSVKKDIIWRVGIIYITMVIFSALIIAKVIQLQFFQRNEWSDKAEKQSEKVLRIESNRGDILDENGRLLAVSVPYYEIRMDLACEGLSIDVFNKDIDSLSICLSKVFADKTARKYKKELTKARDQRKRYFLIQRNVRYDVLQNVKEFPIFRRGRYGGGFLFEKKSKRYIPHGSLANRTIGYTYAGSDGKGVGLEGAYNDTLKGKDGVRLMRKTSSGDWVPIKDGNEVEPEDGKDIVSSINIGIQDVAESALRRQLVKHNAHHGSAVLMEVHTGEIKAIVNLTRDKKGEYREQKNYAVGESSEPGSTFKLASIIAILEDGYVDVDDIVDTKNGKVTYYDKVTKDSKPGGGGYGKITVARAFEVSSNVGISQIIYNNYKNREKKFVERLYNMKLNESLGLEINGEGQPYFQYPGDKYWSGVSLPMMSIGYEVMLTPLQILTFYNAIANDGRMVKPKFVKEFKFHGNVVEQLETQVIHPSICSKSTLKKVKILLEGVVERGTAKNLNNEFISIAGKTGTTQINYANKKEKMLHQASFVGYFPVENPKYSCIVVVHAPSNNVYYGNLVAGPVFLEIAKKVYATSLEMHDTYHSRENIELSDAPYSKSGHKNELDMVFSQLGVPVSRAHLENEWVITNRQDSVVKYKPLVIKDGFVPNVKAMGAKDAIFLLENVGLTVQILGRGTVVSQSLPPGHKINEGETIKLEMSFL